MGRFERVRRPELADLMLLATVTLWALNFTVTKYVISHGFQPCSNMYFVIVMLSAQSRTVPKSITSTREALRTA